MEFRYNNQLIKTNKLNVICGKCNSDSVNFFKYLSREISKEYKISYCDLFSMIDGDVLNYYNFSIDHAELEERVCEIIEGFCGAVLFFEYPEIFLHPEKQSKFARLVVKSLKRNNTIFVLTHSDYIIKELNNLIILNYKLTKEEQEYCELTREEIMEKYGYSKAEMLSKKDVNAFHVSGKNINPDRISDFGFGMKTIDIEINRQNNMWNYLSEGMKSAYE